MTSESFIHSNAFNFLSFVNNSVDPRTGQYTLAIELPELVANNLSGPSLPLRVGFNPMNVGDSGFGSGWTLNLTQYTPANNLLHLHTGESFKVTAGDAGDGTGLALRERKLASFHLYQHGDGWRVVHKAGMIELLELQGPSDNRVALPTRVLAPTGHGITLSYANFQGAPCLTGIVDDTGLSLLAIRYTSSLVTIDLHPVSGPGGTPLASYQIQLDSRFSPPQRLPHTIVLPGPDQASWRLAYQQVRGVVCLSEVSTPVGGVERIAYNDEGHRFPSDAYDPLPRVTRHTIVPGFDQPDMVTTYSYTSNNFLGFGSGITWRDDGEDNLYKNTDSRFSYGSTASYLADGQPLRSITRTFNRFHLLTLQRTEQAHEVFDEGSGQPRRETCVEETQTTYHELPNLTFEQQPAYFQLPRVQSQRWSVLEDLARRREEVVITHYDEHGNLTLESQAAPPVYQGEALDEARTLAGALRTQYSYYPREGEGDDCPADPDAFVRHRKTATQLPAETSEGQADPLRTRYRYRHLPALSAAPQSNGVLMAHEEDVLQLHGEQEQLLQQISRRHAELPTDALLHGRVLVETQRFNDLPTQVEHAYAKRAQLGNEVLEEIQTITGFDHDQPLPDGSRSHALKVITLQHSVFINQPLLTRDDNDVEIAYAYDALRRVVRETVAPGDPALEAARKYTYQLVGRPGGQATQTEEDVNGVVTQTRVDGLNRVVERQRQDADNPNLAARVALRPIYRARYDALGNQVEQTELDWLDYEGQAPRELPLSRQFLFDGWGNQYCEIAPDQVRHYDRLDPIGTRLWQGPQQTSWRESADGAQRTGTTVTWLTLFEEPTRVERFGTDGVSVSVNQLFYDGLQRKAREVNARNEVKRFAYDAFDRLAEETLADDNVVHRDYARHSGEDLPVLIRVGDVVLGEQRFDGLDRMTESITGGRSRQFSYEHGQVNPSQVRTPAGQLVEYRYLPQLSEEPLMRQITTQQIHTDYEYDGKNARLQRCEEQGLVLSRAYFSHGEVSRETREYQGQTHTMHYQTSLLGRQLGYLDVMGNLQSYDYDAHGRLTRTALSGITSEFDYDALGRMARIDTREGDRYLTTTLHHDDFDREVRRDFDMGGTQQSLTQTYDGEDAIVTKTLSEGSTALRHETFEYDLRARLIRYECEGSVLPEDPYGKVIQRQLFRFDALDNITRVDTTFAEGVNQARYYFENEDPAQLSRIENSHADYPAQIALAYDADGNLILDEAGRTLEYDGLGRLVGVEAPTLIERAFDEHGNLVWDERGRRLTADANGKLLKVGVPCATTVAVDVQARAGLTPMREADGRLLWCERIAQGAASTYGYDALDRLTSQES